MLAVIRASRRRRPISRSMISGSCFIARPSINPDLRKGASTRLALRSNSRKGAEFSTGGGWKSVARGDRSGRGCEVIVEAELHDIDLSVEVEVVNEPAANDNVVEVEVSMVELHEVV